MFKNAYLEMSECLTIINKIALVTQKFIKNVRPTIQWYFVFETKVRAQTVVRAKNNL